MKSPQGGVLFATVTRAERIIRTHAQDVRVVRQDGDDGALRIEGYAIKWDDQYDLEPFWSEQIQRGAFKDSLEERDVAVLNGHMREQVIGSTRSGTTVEETAEGLKFNAVLNGTTIARDVYEMVDNGDVEGVSVGMRIRDEKREEGAGKDGMDLYTILRADLYEFSMTAFPAYEDTEAVAREADERLNERRRGERIIVDAFSRRLGLRRRRATIELERANLRANA